MTETELIAAIPALAFQAALLFVRIGAAVMVMPGLGEMDIPAPVRLAIALAVTVVAFPVIGTSLPASPDTFIETTRLIAIESLIGLWLGWLSRAIVLAFAMAGQFIALMMGLAMAFMPDQMLGGQTAPTSRFLGLLAACLILASGLYTVPLRAVFES